jgi:hypothetical protein
VLRKRRNLYHVTSQRTVFSVVYIIPGSNFVAVLYCYLPSEERYAFVYCVRCTAYCVLYTLYCILRAVYVVLHTVYCVRCTAYCVLYTLYCILHTVYVVLHTAYFLTRGRAADCLNFVRVVISSDTPSIYRLSMNLHVAAS